VTVRLLDEADPSGLPRLEVAGDIETPEVRPICSGGYMVAGVRRAVRFGFPNW
jgi:hypothetical protein